MTLCDAGPLIALVNAGDRNHDLYSLALDELRGPLVTTWPCLTEAMHLLGRYGGHPAQDELWGFLDDPEALRLHAQGDGERERMRELMRQYSDLPMDLGDASLVAAAEALAVQRVFTLDRHFLVYRTAGRNPLQVVP